VIGLPNGQRLEFIWIPTPGEFMMGDAPQGGQDDHRPRVRLTKAFYISKTPVTQAEYEGIAGSNPSQFKDSGPNAPVERVSWDEAMEFCRKTTESLRANGQNAGWEITLPTEAQWEYACRAGTDTAYYTGDSESDLSRAGWYSGNSGQRTHPVGEKEANAWGLYDMHGNVWQWCFDWYGDLPSGSAVDPTGASSGPNRVYRGGSWRFDAVNCRSAHRTGFEPGFRFNNVGFRLALSSVR
jgi:formylglycine-generating enzyme required for sulfatase activity